MIRSSRAVSLGDTSQVAEARRVALQCAEAMRFSETAAAKAALVTTELATNLVKHANGGTILFASDELQPDSLTIIAIDKGPGITNVNGAMRDGFSTAGSPGTGLGAIQRAASHVDIYAQNGTAVLCRIDNEPASPRVAAFPQPSRIVVGGVCMPKPGEEESGDAWIAFPGREVVTIAVADGLGHGHAAAAASNAFVRSMRERPELDLDQLLRNAHGALRPTRGAAAAVARIHLAQGRLDYSGVGNIAATISSDEAVRKTVSLNGIVGHEMRKTQTFSYPWTASSVLLMQSDGITTSWNFAAYPGLLQHDPALIAAVIYRDHCRGSDDATVVVAKAS